MHSRILLLPQSKAITALLTRVFNSFSIGCLCLASVAGLQAREIVVTDPVQLQSTADALQPGDTLSLSSGHWSDIHLTILAEGTAEAPITIKAHTPGKTIIEGASRIAIGGSHIVVDGLHFRNAYTPILENIEASIGPQPKPDEEVLALIDFIGSPEAYATDCRVTNCYFQNCNPADLRRYHWVRLWGQRNRVDHCRFEGQDHRGVTVQVRAHKPDGEHRIDHNYFYDRKAGNGNGFECIQIGQSWASMSRSGSIIENNIFEECDGETEILSSKTCENLIRGNLFLRSRGTLTIRHGNRTTAEGNIFLGDGKPGAGGIRVIGEDHKVIGNYFHKINSFTGGVIVLYSGIPDSPINGYVAAHRTQLSDNVIIAPQGIAIYLNGGFGSRDRTILAEDVSIQGNIIVPGNGFGDVIIAGNLPSANISDNLYNRGELGRPDPNGFTRTELKLFDNDNGLKSIEAMPPLPPTPQVISQMPDRKDTGPIWISKGSN